ncbi:MAG: HD-GYP domain-containing protein [Burkholderiales bacterium]
MEKRRVALGELAIGGVVPWDVYDGQGRLLLSKGHVITSSNQIEALIERGLFTEGEPRRERGKTAPPPEQARSTTITLILDARTQLQGICAPNAPHEHFPEQVLHIRRLLHDACRQNRNVALASILLEREGRYSIRHSVDAAIICDVVGSAMNIAEAELTALVAAALTMNISMLRLQDDLQGNRHPLTAEQREIIASHPQHSVAMLQQLGVTDSVWLDTVLNHHEAIDGSGYPSHRKGEDIALPAQLLAMADIYCARISGRDYRPALRASSALKALFLNQGAAIDKNLAACLVKATGIYPPGTPVRLENGEIALVIEQGEKANTPLVGSLIGPSGTRFAIPIQRDTGRPGYAVHDIVEWAQAGPLPSMRLLWGKEGAVG